MKLDRGEVHAPLCGNDKGRQREVGRLVVQTPTAPGSPQTLPGVEGQHACYLCCPALGHGRADGDNRADRCELGLGLGAETAILPR